MKKTLLGVIFVVSLCLGSREAAAASKPAVPVLDTQAQVEIFILQSYERGVPCEKAQQLGREAVPFLSAMLEKAGYEEYWENVVVTMGCIGDETAVESLQKFWKAHQGQVSFETFQALLNVPTALSLIARTGSSKAFEALTQLADQEYWESTRVSVFDDVLVDSATVRQNILRSMIVALGATGQKEAVEVLRRLERPSPSGLHRRQARDETSSVSVHDARGF